MLLDAGATVRVTNTVVVLVCVPPPSPLIVTVM
jgi:hypothetical protein